MKKYIYNNVINYVGSLNELQVFIIVQGVRILALLDSGSETSIISKLVLDKNIPGWERLEDLPGPTAGVAANGEEFEFRANKSFKVSIGAITEFVRLSVPDNLEAGTIIGIDLMKIFKIDLTFSLRGVEVRSGGKKICTKRNWKCFTIKNPNKIRLWPNKVRMVELKSPLIIEGRTYFVMSQELCHSVVVPSLVLGNGGSMSIPVFNDGRKRLIIPAKGLGVEVQEVDEEMITIENLNDPGARADMIKDRAPPIPIFNKYAWYNQGLYTKVRESVIRSAFANNIFKSPNVIEPDEETLEELTNIVGIEIPWVEFPIPEVTEVLEAELPKDLTPEQRNFLMDLFKKYPETVARYSYDVGTLRNHDGSEIKVTLPLKKEVPREQKYYKLSNEEEDALQDILDYLLYNNLAEECELNAQFGAPVFLIERGTPGSPRRVIFDVRKQNSVIDFPTSTPSDSVIHPLKKILANSRWLSNVDLTNGYYSLKLSDETLATGISQIYTRCRALRLRACPTGCSAAPQLFRGILDKQLNINEDGNPDPLSQGKKNIAVVWFDDILLGSDGSERHHMEYLERGIKRISRLGAKIKIKKSQFFKRIQTDSFNVLGFCISKGSIVPDAKKLNTILDTPSPKNQKDVMRFLGYVTYLRELVPPTLIHLSSILSELTSPKKSFEWTPKHQEAFEEMKKILALGINFLEPTSAQGIKIIYCDSSARLLAGLIFNYCFDANPEVLKRVEVPTTLESVGVESPFYLHLKHHKIKARWVNRVGLEKLTHLERLLLQISRIGGQLGESLPLDLKRAKNTLLNGLFSNIVRMQSRFSTRRVQEFFTKVYKEEILDPTFNYFSEEILYLLALVTQTNIKLVIGNGEPNREPFQVVNQDHHTDLLIGYDCGADRLGVFYVVEDYNKGDLKIVANNLDKISNHTPQELADHFNETLKSGNARKSIQLIAQFSRTITKPESRLPIWHLELLSLLESLKTFSTYIKMSPANIILTDSRICYFLLSPQVWNSSKKIQRWAIKCSLEYENMFVLHVSGKAQLADLFSRIGLEKEKFFLKSLTPVQIDKMHTKELEGQITSWADTYRLVQNNPELIKFSEKKLPADVVGKFYLDMGTWEEEKIQCNLSRGTSWETARDQIRILDDLLSRAALMKYQEEELDMSKYDVRNGVATSQGRIVLPNKLLGVALLREHFLSNHMSKHRLKDLVLNIYEVSARSRLLQLSQLLTSNCISCIITKPGRDTFMHGSFPIEAKGTAIQMDMVERLPNPGSGITPVYILTIVDVYTSYLSTYLLNSKRINPILNCLLNYLSVHGAVRYIVTDNFSSFTSRQFLQWCAHQGIKRPSSCVYRSRSRGIVERFNKELEVGIRVFALADRLRWSSLIPLVVHQLNNRPFKGSNLTPSQLQLGETFARAYRPEIQETFKGILGPTEEDKQKFLQKLTIFETELMDMREKEKRARKKEKNEKRVPHKFKPLDLVLCKFRSTQVGVSQKLQVGFSPLVHQVVKTASYVVYCKELITGVVTPRNPADIKLLKGLDDAQLEEINMSKALARQLSQITADDLMEQFEEIRMWNKTTGPRTRSRTKAVEGKLTMSQLAEEFLDLEDYEDDRRVRFEDD